MRATSAMKARWRCDGGDGWWKGASWGDAFRGTTLLELRPEPPIPMAGLPQGWKPRDCAQQHGTSSLGVKFARMMHSVSGAMGCRFKTALLPPDVSLFHAREACLLARSATFLSIAQIRLNVIVHLHLISPILYTVIHPFAQGNGHRTQWQKLTPRRKTRPRC
jgi:hypothetical protein